MGVKVTPRANNPDRGFVRLDCIPYRMADGVMREGTQCQFRVNRGIQNADKAGVIWGWDGNEDSPTLSPSIHCQSCGLHVNVIKGKLHKSA